jgi:hybrid cluster-associated redox disulfide protein
MIGETFRLRRDPRATRRYALCDPIPNQFPSDTPGSLRQHNVATPPAVQGEVSKRGTTMVTHAIDDMTVAQIMSRWPATIGVFITYDMRCIGCPIAIFHTLAEAAGEHRLDLIRLTSAIRCAAGPL